MSEQRDWPAEKLRDAFEAHEHLAPEAPPVHARIEELARGYRLRRRGLQAVGGVVAGAGLVAGVVAVPSLLPGGSKHEVKVQSVAAAPLSTPTPKPTPTTDDDASTPKDPAWAFFAAGYGYDDAVKLAQIWNKTDISAVKVEASKKIAAGEKLPIAPEYPLPPVDKKKDLEVGAFFNAGYDYNDAVKLAKRWHLANAYDAKVKGGKEILAGQTLPIKP